MNRVSPVCRRIRNGSYCSPQLSPAVFAMVRPMTREAVAAGEGTLRTCNILPEGTN